MKRRHKALQVQPGMNDGRHQELHVTTGDVLKRTTGDSRRNITIFHPSASTAASIAATVSLREDIQPSIQPRNNVLVST